MASRTFFSVIRCLRIWPSAAPHVAGQLPSAPCHPIGGPCAGQRQSRLCLQEPVGHRSKTGRLSKRAGWRSIWFQGFICVGMHLFTQILIEYESQYIIPEIICTHFPAKSVGDIPELLFQLFFFSHKSASFFSRLFVIKCAYCFFEFFLFLLSKFSNGPLFCGLSVSAVLVFSFVLFAIQCLFGSTRSVQPVGPW